MKKASEDEFEEMPDEIDFADGERGRYAGSVEPLRNLVLIEPELFETFPSAEAVNEALRILKKASMEATAMVKPPKQARAS